MGLIYRVGDLIERLSLWWQKQVGCKHPYPEARVELIPGYDQVRYYWECPCGATWDD